MNELQAILENESKFREYIKNNILENYPDVEIINDLIYEGDYIINKEILITVKYSYYPVDIVPIRGTKDSMLKYKLTQGIIITNNTFTNYAIDYVNGSKIKLIDNVLLNEYISGRKKFTDQLEKTIDNEDVQPSAPESIENTANYSERVEATNENINSAESTTAYTFHENNSDSTQESNSDSTQRSKQSSFQNQKTEEKVKVEVEATIENSNDEQQEDSTETINFEDTRNIKKKKSDIYTDKRKKKWIKIVFILFIFLVLFGEDISDFIDNVETNQEIARQPVTDPYEFDPNDVALDSEPNPFSQGLTGQELTIYSNDERFKSSDQFDLVVGTDIEPGVYTLTQSGYLHADLYDTALNESIYMGEDGSMYNIPLIDGDVVTIENYNYFDDSETAELNFIPQSEYVEFTPGMNGVFVYGQSYFDSTLEISPEDYDSLIYCYPIDGSYSYQNCEWYYQDFTAKLSGIAGSYFIIES